MVKKITKRIKKIKKNIDFNRFYSILDALKIIKEQALTSFNESIDVAINLNIDTKKSDQNIRGTVILPYGHGKIVRIAVFAQGDSAIEAKEAGIKLVGMDDLVDSIKKNKKINFDIVIATPESMPIVAKIGSILGPHGLMPNPKLGTVTSNITKTIKQIKTGKIQYRNDKNGIIHTSIGKINFNYEFLQSNLITLISSIKKEKPSNTKSNYIKKISLSSTMGIGLSIDKNILELN